jgi:hypothetical protein
MFVDGAAQLTRITMRFLRSRAVFLARLDSNARHAV